MTFAASERIGISRQRGFWLRCFLGRTSLLAALVILVCATADANECTYKTLHVRSVHGYVVDENGHTLSAAKVLIKQLEKVVLRSSDPRVVVKRGGKVVLDSITDQRGNFRLKVPPGEYELDVQAEGFAPAHAYLKVGFGFQSLFHSNRLAMRVSPVNLCRQQEREDRTKTQLRLQGA